MPQWFFRTMLVAAAALAAGGGCATVGNFEQPYPYKTKSDKERFLTHVGGRQIYGGTRFELAALSGGLSLAAKDPVFGTLALVNIYTFVMIADLPLSFVADTLTLPWTIPASRERRLPDVQDQPAAGRIDIGEPSASTLD